MPQLLHYILMFITTMVLVSLRMMGAAKLGEMVGHAIVLVP